jgi:hypothetical protein
MYDAHRFHAVFLVLAAGPDGIRYGDLARGFRSRAVRLPAIRLRAMLADLVNRGVLTVRGDGRTVRYGPAAQAGALLGEVSVASLVDLRYRADQVARVIRALREGREPAGEDVATRMAVTGKADTDPGADLVSAVRALAQETATGLVSLAVLKRRTGLDRESLHEAVKRHMVAGELLLHPIAACHQEAAAEMAEGIRTPAGQNLFYVEVL